MSIDAITAEVRALERLDLEGLRAEWRRRYGEPPKLRSVDFLACLLAWRIQSDAFGGLDPSTIKLIKQKALAAGGPKLTPGVRLERDWKGVRHVVEVTDGGYVWQGQTHTSLTKIATLIAGTKWNGPKFFGLRSEAA